MTKSAISEELTQKTIDFHGHSCPGLAIGIRVSELALAEMGRASDEDIVAVVETDMCAVDAIQFLTGCTYGKGNLIHMDYGKNVFTFYRRKDKKGIRIRLRSEMLQDTDKELSALRKKMVLGGRLSLEEENRLKEEQSLRRKRIMDANLEDLFEIRPSRGPLPEKARIMESLTCESCGEATMESRTRRFQGKTLCIPCFEAVERRY